MILSGTKVSLPEICELVTDGTHDSPKLQVSGVPFIKGKHISSGRIDFASSDFITDKDHLKCIQRVKPQKNDVLFTNIGSIGDAARVSDDTEFSIKNVALFRPNPEKVDPLFFYYLVISPYFRGQFLNLSSGSAQPFISLESFRSLRFNCLQNRIAQERIGRVLSAYDDLIENNGRRIQLLEQAARLLYKEWFVHLRFPGHEHVKIIEDVPEGWEKGTVADFGECITGKTPSTKIPENFSGNILFVKTPDMHRSRIIIETEESLSDRGAATQHKKTLPVGTILVACIGAKLGVVSITGRPCQTNQQINAVIPYEDYMRHYILFALIDIKPRLEAMGGGATMPNVNKTKFASIPVLIPSQRFLKEFEVAVKKMFQQIELLKQQNSSFTRARDLLLPRLMNGEITV